MRVWIGLVLTLQLQFAVAQCPDRSAVVGKLKQVSQLKNKQLQLDSLIQLRRVCQRCHYADDSTYIRLLNRIVSTCFFLSDLRAGSAYLRKAEPYLQEAIQVGTRPYAVAKSLQVANSYYYRGVLLDVDERLPEAVLVYDQAISAGKQSGKTGMWEYSFLKQALDYYQLGDYERCLTKAQSGSYYYGQRNEIRYQAQCTGLQALALGTMNHVGEAAQLLANAIDKVRAIDPHDTDLGDYYLQLGDLSIQLHQPQAALTNFQKAVEVFTIHNNPQSVSVYNRIGYLYLHHFDDPSQAKQSFQLVVSITTSVYERAKAHTGLGDIHRLAGQFQSALASYQTGLQALPIDFSDKRLVHNPSAVSIRTAANKEYLLTLIQNKADVWLDWAKTSPNRSYLQNALQTYQLADQMIDFMRWEQTGQQSKLYWRQKTHGLYERAIETSFSVGDANSAYRFIEKSRAVLLADKLNELGARRHLPPDLVRVEQRVRRHITNLQDQLTTQPPASRQYVSTRHALFNEQERLDSLIRQLETSHPAYYRTKYSNTLAPVSQVQAWLDKHDAALVSYFVGDSAVYIVGVTPTEVKLSRLPIRAYEQAIRHFRQLLTTTALNSRHQFSRFVALSHALYRQLVYPLALPAGRVVVSPDGDFIPFEALSRSASGADYLLNEYAFSYTYSMQVLLNEQPVSKATTSFLGMAPVEFTNMVVQHDSGYRRQSLPSLRGSAAAQLRSSAEFTNPTLLTNQRATRLSFLTQAPQARIVQLFTHADAFSPDQGSAPLEPTLFFADSALRLSELQSHSGFATQLLVLMACETGIGVHQKGEGVFSLARGFAALGVPSIVTTLWSVEDQSTYRLAELFQGQLARGLPKDIALQRAKLQFYESATLIEQLPNHWAGVILLGNADPLTEANSLWLVAIGILIVSICGVGLFYLKKKRATRLTK